METRDLGEKNTHTHTPTLEKKGTILTLLEGA